MSFITFSGELLLFGFKLPDLILMLTVLLHCITVPSGLLWFGYFNVVSRADLAQDFPLG